MGVTMEFFRDLTQAYSWGSIKHPISSEDNEAKLNWKEIVACGGIAFGVGVVTLPAFPLTAFAAYYLSRHYLLKKKITPGADKPSSKKIHEAVQNSDSPLRSKRASAEVKMEQEHSPPAATAAPALPESPDNAPVREAKGKEKEHPKVSENDENDEDESPQVFNLLKPIYLTEEPLIDNEILNKLLNEILEKPANEVGEFITNIPKNIT